MTAADGARSRGARDRRRGRARPLTPTEFRLLALLVARAGEVVRRAALVAAAWPDGAIVNDNTLDAYVARLAPQAPRGGDRRGLKTARGVGYVLR